MMNYEERKKRALQRAAEEQGVNNKNTEQRTQKARLDIIPGVMEGLTKTKLLSSSELERTVNAVFRPKMPEYDGCRIIVNGSFIVTEIFFAERENDSVFNDGMIRVLAPRNNEDKSRSASSIVSRYNNRNKMAIAYTLTDAGKDALSEFIDYSCFKGNIKNLDIDWRKCSTEVVERDQYGRSKTLVKVVIDIRKLFSVIYGSRTDNGGKLLYEIGLIRPLMSNRDQNGNLFVSKWLMSITQLDENLLQKTLKEAGLDNTIGDLGINRDFSK